MQLLNFIAIFALHLHLVQPQNSLVQLLMEQTNFLLYNATNIIEDTVDFLPSYDFIVIGSGSGGSYRRPCAICFHFIHSNNPPSVPKKIRFRDGQPTEREQEVESAAAGSRPARDISHGRATNSFRKLGYCE